MATGPQSCSLGCGVVSAPEAFPEVFDNGILFSAIGGTTNPQWVTDNDFDDGVAIDYGSADTSVFIIPTVVNSDLAGDEGNLTIGDYQRSTLLAFELYVPSGSISGSTILYRLGSGGGLGFFQLRLHDDGSIEFAEFGDSSSFSQTATSFYPTDQKFSFFAERRPITGVTNRWYAQVDSNSPSIVPLTSGTLINFDDYFADDSGTTEARSPGAYIGAASFAGKVGRFEHIDQGTGVANLVDGGSAYSHTYQSCPAVDPGGAFSDFWQDFVRTEERAD